MKHRLKGTITLFFLFLLFIFSSQYCYALGYWSSYRNAKYSKWETADTYILIGFIIVTILVVIYFWKGLRFVIRMRQRRTTALLNQLSKEDIIWDKTTLTAFVNNAFIKIQEAWEDRDMETALEIVSSKVYAKYQRKWQRQKNLGYTTKILKIQVNNIQIVGIEDYAENRYDNFTAYISGEMVDVVTYFNGVVEDRKPLVEFNDLYQFLRYHNTWIITSISNTVDIMDINKLKIKKERSWMRFFKGK